MKFVGIPQYRIAKIDVQAYILCYKLIHDQESQVSGNWGALSDLTI